MALLFSVGAAPVEHWPNGRRSTGFPMTEVDSGAPRGFPSHDWGHMVQEVVELSVPGETAEVRLVAKAWRAVCYFSHWNPRAHHIVQLGPCGTLLVLLFDPKSFLMTAARAPLPAQRLVLHVVPGTQPESMGLHPAEKEFHRRLGRTLEEVQTSHPPMGFYFDIGRITAAGSASRNTHEC